jgi:hypothetical protein
MADFPWIPGGETVTVRIRVIHSYLKGAIADKIETIPKKASVW